MKTNFISIKYEDKYMPKTFSGKEYAYICNKEVNVGDLVIAPTQYGDKIALVTQINIPEVQIKNVKPYLKEITEKINCDKYIYNNQVMKDVA